MTHITHVPTRILVLSDTHSALPDPVNKPDLRFSHKLPEADVAIHCGDLTSCGKIHEHERAIAVLKSLPAPIKIVIPGNHDMTLDTVYLQQNKYLHGWKRPHEAQDARDVIALYTSREAKEAGIVYIIEGLHSFILPNGAKLMLYASAFTPEFCNWGFAYPRSHDRFNVVDGNVPTNPVPSFTADKGASLSNQVTVVVTHGPPRGILDKTIHGESVGCDHLLTAVSRCRPLLHCFGHIHEAWGVETKTWSDQAQKEHAIGLEETELRRADPSTEITQNRDDHADVRSPPHSVKDTRQNACIYADNQAVRLEAQMIKISHPTERSGTNTPGTPENIQNVSVVDARAIEHGKQTVFVNASIMDVRYVPRQWPWLVQVDLPCASDKETEKP